MSQSNIQSSNYTTSLNIKENKVLEQAAEIIAKKFLRGDVFSNPNAVKDFLTYKMADYEREVFAVLLLDNQHRLIEFHELFFGTINAANVYPREVLKLVLDNNASAVIFAHNHPSGVPEPSDADKQITATLKDALELIDVRVLDHFVVGGSCLSFAEKGLLN